jgi:hypothetical protein
MGVYLTRRPSEPDPRPSGPRGRLAGPTPWPAGHAARLLGHHLAPNRLIQVGGGPIHPYKYPPHGESQHNTLYL